jgi:hypothetical protein
MKINNFGESETEALRNKLICGNEIFSEPTSFPADNAENMWVAYDNFSILNNIPTLSIVGNGGGTFYQNVDYLIPPLEDEKIYRFEWILQNVIKGDLTGSLYIYTDTGEAEHFSLPIINGKNHIDFIYHDNEYSGSPSISIEGSSGSFEVIKVSLKPIPMITGTSGFSGMSGFSGSEMGPGNTGGVDSAGSGNQYVTITIQGVEYKILHDGQATGS